MHSLPSSGRSEGLCQRPCACSLHDRANAEERRPGEGAKRAGKRKDACSRERSLRALRRALRLSFEEALMPQAASRLCPGCRQRVTGKCAVCEARRQKSVNLRRTADKSFYDSSAWTLIRTDQLARSPFCVAVLEDGMPCNRIATHVDHKVAREAGGSDLPDNLQSLCRSCHSRKTASQDGGFGNRRRSGM